jgi:hypothetical protein
MADIAPRYLARNPLHNHQMSLLRTQERRFYGLVHESSQVFDALPHGHQLFIRELGIASV